MELTVMSKAVIDTIVTHRGYKRVETSTKNYVVLDEQDLLVARVQSHPSLDSQAFVWRKRELFNMKLNKTLWNVQ